MRIFNRPIFVSAQDRLLAKGQKKLFEEMRQAHLEDVAIVTAMSDGAPLRLENGTTTTKEDWLALATTETTELTEQIDALSEYT